MTFQPSEGLRSAFWDTVTLVDTDADLARGLAAIADALTIERLTAAAAEGPWKVDHEDPHWWVSQEFRQLKRCATEREAIMVCGALNLAAQRTDSR